MTFSQETDMRGMLMRMQREIRDLQEHVAKGPSREWRAVEDGDELKWRHVRTGNDGPPIGTVGVEPEPESQ